MTLQPFFTYNLAGGWGIGSSPIVTGDWYATGNKWTVPVGAQVSKLIKSTGMPPVNLLLGAYYNPIRERFGSTWNIRAQVAFIF